MCSEEEKKTADMNQSNDLKKKVKWSLSNKVPQAIRRSILITFKDWSVNDFQLEFNSKFKRDLDCQKIDSEKWEQIEYSFRWSWKKVCSNK